MFEANEEKTKMKTRAKAEFSKNVSRQTPVIVICFTNTTDNNFTQ